MFVGNGCSHYLLEMNGGRIVISCAFLDCCEIAIPGCGWIRLDIKYVVLHVMEEYTQFGAICMVNCAFLFLAAQT